MAKKKADGEAVLLENDAGGVATEVVSGEANVVVPTMEDVGWRDYIMSQFEPDELDDGYPKTQALRRVARKNIGPIIKGSAHTVQVPTIDNEYRATVEYTVVFKKIKGLGLSENPYELTYTDVADAYFGNINGKEFSVFPTTIASTRAEARALRKALNLDVAASEELTDQPLEAAGISGEITIGQITKIDLKCQQLNINVMKFINQGRGKKPDTPLYESINEVSHSLAIKMYKKLNDYQQGIVETPESIRGYKPTNF